MQQANSPSSMGIPSNPDFTFIAVSTIPGWTVKTCRSGHSAATNSKNFT